VFGVSWAVIELGHASVDECGGRKQDSHVRQEGWEGRQVGQSSLELRIEEASSVQESSVGGKAREDCLT